MLLLPLAFVLCANGTARACGDEEEVQVTIVSVLATSKDKKIDKKLTDLAKKIQEKWPELTGFKIDKQVRESMIVGKERQFEFVDEKKAVVTVCQGADDDNKVRLKVKLPCTGEYCYKTCCGKFFPIATCHKTKKGECLFIAVMVEPCKGK
jgi:hypothetical protein